MTDQERAEFEHLRRRLQQAEETIAAIRTGAVDAFLVQEQSGQRVYTLEGADRPYRLLVEEMQQGAATLQADGTIVYGNRRLAELLDLPLTRLIGQRLRSFIVPDDVPSYDRLLTFPVTKSEGGEVSIIGQAGKHVPVLLTLNALPSECGAAVGVLITDLTSQRHQEEQKLLVDELNHRVKNTLASVQSIAQQTLRRTKDPAKFAASFGGRIQSMARAHTMLSVQTWQGIDLRSLINDQIVVGPYDATRVEVSGPVALIEPQLALRLAMVMHELAVNACKYGALSNETGRLLITWQVEGGRLHLTWVERNSAPFDETASRGFGTAFIARTIESQGGKAELTGHPDGLTWSLNLPLPENQGWRPRKKVTSAEPTQRRLPNGSALSHKRILIVEDEPLVAMDLVAVLEDAHCELIGPVSTVADALQIIQNEFLDGALVDGNLNGASVEDIASALTARNIAFAFVSGYDRARLPTGFPRAQLISKPFSPDVVCGVLENLLAG